jgi:hypothetical protein
MLTEQFPGILESGAASAGLLGITIAGALFAAALVVRALVEHLIQRPLDRLFRADNIASIIGSYALFIFGILLLVSLSFMAIRYLGWGYITYGQCSDSFSRDMIKSDPKASGDYFYFAAVTFFTIGYGDICPMGASKLLAIVTAFIGNAITVVLMGIVLALYLNRRNGARE